MHLQGVQGDLEKSLSLCYHQASLYIGAVFAHSEYSQQIHHHFAQQTHCAYGNAGRNYENQISPEEAAAERIFGAGSPKHRAAHDFSR